MGIAEHQGILKKIDEETTTTGKVICKVEVDNLQFGWWNKADYDKAIQEIKVGEVVRVVYTEKPNPQNTDSPYRNINSLYKPTGTEVPIEEVKDSPSPQPPTQSGFREINGVVFTNEVNLRAFEGMVFNNTVRHCLEVPLADYLGKNILEFKKIYNSLFDLALDLRKEKGG